MQPGSSVDGVNKQSLTLQEYLVLWKQHEDIAMHFNELIARFRVQALGGTATIGALATLFTKAGEGTAPAHVSSAWVFFGIYVLLVSRVDSAMAAGLSLLSATARRRCRSDRTPRN